MAAFVEVLPKSELFFQTPELVIANWVVANQILQRNMFNKFCSTQTFL